MMPRSLFRRPCKPAFQRVPLFSVRTPSQSTTSLQPHFNSFSPRTFFFSCCGSAADSSKDPAGVKPKAPAATTSTGGVCDLSSGCCPTKRAPSAEEVVNIVRDGYAEVSRNTTRGRTEVEVEAASQVAEGMGYSKEELTSVPSDANMGLQCGNPMKHANLQPGEVVVDLGSGGGIDVFLAAGYVGPTGKAIGIDMTPEMVNQARANAATANISNVEFHLAEITKMPLPDNSVDCIISNCVINLAPNKMDVFKEMFRVLKPGGRVAVSDVVLKDVPLPELVKSNMQLLVGCIAGAIKEQEYVTGLQACGFEAVTVTDGGQDLDKMWRPAVKEGEDGPVAVCCGVSTPIDPALLNFNVNTFVFSGKVEAQKPSL